MKRNLMAALSAVLLSVLLTGATVFAATEKTVSYYDEAGRLITVNGLYYDAQGLPRYNSACYYTNEEGQAVYVGGCRVYYYDQEGNLAPGLCYYDGDGNIVPCPASHPGGWGYGSWCYNARGVLEQGAYYYDESGNPVNPPAAAGAQVYRSYRGHGCCHGRGY